MSVSIEIRPHSDALDMYGELDKATAYSLSGDISITLSSPCSFFERRHLARLLLQSLIVEFEGYSELITQRTGYSSFRLYHQSRELINSEPVELTNEGQEDALAPCVWTIAFNLVIPGWLPPTSSFGDSEHRDAGTRYTLYATAKYLSGDSGSWLSSCCPLFFSRARTVTAPRCDIPLRRFISCPSPDLSSMPSPFPTVDYTVYAEQQRGLQGPSRMPADVISKLRAVVSVPEYVDVTDSSFPACLRMRTSDLPASECKKIRLTDFSVEIQQVESYRASPTALYRSFYPIPPASEQPPNKPLRNPHPMQALYEVGLAPIAPTDQAYTLTRSLLPSRTCNHYTLSGDGYVFSDDADPGNESTWYSMRTQVPFRSAPQNEGPTINIRAGHVHETYRSPLFTVRHHVHISLTCSYDLTEGEGPPKRATEVLQFDIPIRFARSLPYCTSNPLPPPDPAALSNHPHHIPSRSLESLSSSIASSMLYAQVLPAYSQLFDYNGDRKIDYSTPLPAYTPPSASASASTASLVLPSDDKDHDC